MIKGKNISLTFKGKNILKSISFNLPKGRLAAFIGKSGGGKTSLLKCLGSLHSYEGEILLGGKNLQDFSFRERAEKIGFVFQHYDLFPHMNVKKNCTHPLQYLLKMSKEQADKRAEALLDMLGLTEVQQSYPSELSGGQQQRAAIARSLALAPEILIFDEPTAALDPENTKIIHKIIEDLLKKGMTIIISSHDMEFLRHMLDLVYFMEQGEIVESFDVKLEFLKEKTRISNFLRLPKSS